MNGRACGRKATKGIQDFSLPLDLKKCGECHKAKLRNIAGGKSEDTNPTEPGQILGIDFGLMYQKSKNKNRAELLKGYTGCNAYIIIIDSYSDLLLVAPTSIKHHL